MPVPTHFKIVFRGIFENTEETWSFGTHFSRTVEAGPDAGVGAINTGAVTTALDTFFGTAGAFIPSWVRASDWRAYEIGTDGLMENEPLMVDVMPDDIQGVASGSRNPPQIALAVTTVGDNRGPGRFGRFYLPTAAIVELADFRVSIVNATSVATAATAFLKGISDAIDLPGTIGSSSALNISKSGAGFKQQVDHVEVGRVLDTLRSRRRALLEERVVGGQIDW